MEGCRDVETRKNIIENLDVVGKKWKNGSRGATRAISEV